MAAYLLMRLKKFQAQANKLDEKVWDQLVFEADVDGDGVISIDEFKIMMQKLLKDPSLKRTGAQKIAFKEQSVGDEEDV